ncbi:MAG: flagellar motor protein MotB [Deltaproteobacteria bacterium]|jgi:chemotaxis protein MotB|nr:flagellar motor protein MotB [Deltaproteobacteria bacterium]
MRRRSHHSTEQDSNSARWLTTFNDLVTLLMVFFVLLFTMSSVDAKKMQDFQFALQSGLGILKAGRNVDISIKTTQPVEDMSHILTQAEGTKRSKKDEPLSGLASDALIKSLTADFGIKVIPINEGIRLSFEDQILFDFGKAHINPDGHALLNRVAKVIQKRQDAVRVEGHTDNIPIRTPRFPSNWELSVARAVNVVKYFVELGNIDPRRLSAVGYGESRPLVANDTPANRMQNRRVEILLLTEGKQENVK